jgi:hypothetical protein
MIKAEVVADSISPAGKRLTTIQYTAHRYILAEFNTHRVFSRNARSSRAVPTAKMIEEVRTNPAMPIALARNKPGMQAGELLSVEEEQAVLELWIEGSRLSADLAEEMLKRGAHKQWTNRLLEPYLWVHGLVSSTEWDNWFDLRIHADAQPEIMALAICMKTAMDVSKPKFLQPSEWHLPYVLPEEALLSISDRCSLSVARCARISYTPFDGNPSLEKEIERAKGLKASKHWSPYEHQATPDEGIQVGFETAWLHPKQHRNFVGWRQLRAMTDIHKEI